MQIVIHFFFVCRNADGAVYVERNYRFGKQTCGLQEVVCRNGHENVKLEVALRCRHSDSYIVAHDLNGYHRDRFALRWIYFSGHYGRAGLVFGNMYFPETVTRTGSQPTDVVCYFHHVAGGRFYCTVSEYEFIF